MPKRRLPPSTRRQFLMGSAALGLAAASPLLLTSCGGSDEPSPRDTGKRETRHLHFDLSHAPIAAPRLDALRSLHHRAPLIAHDADSRTRHRALNAALAGVADEHLTHYLEDVDLPAESMQSLTVRGQHPVTGAPVLAGMFIHVPSAPRAAAQARAARRQSQSQRERPLAVAAAPENIADLATPFDIAAFLVFHHPEVMNLQPDLGAEIMNRIQTLPCNPNDASCVPALGSLAFQIAVLIGRDGWPTTAPGSWATLVPFSDLNGVVQLDADGQPIYRYLLSDEINDGLRVAVSSILASINDDTMFKGTNWHATTGITTRPPVAPTALAAAAAQTFRVSATLPPGSTLDGIRMVGLTVVDPTLRIVRLSIKNDFLRFLSIYAQYLDSGGNILPLANPGQLDTGNSQYITAIGSNDQIMGVPLFGNDVGTSDIEITMPAAASSVTVMFGSLGARGGNPFCPEAVTGASLTLALNIGIPTMLLAAGVYANLKAGWDTILSDQTILQFISKTILAQLGGSTGDFASGIYGSASTQSITSFLAALGNVALQALFAVAPKLLVQLGIAIGTIQAAFVCVLVGLAIRILAVAANAFAIGVSLGESMACPAISTNTLSLSMDSVVRVSRDARDFRFPASAVRLELDAIYSGGATPVHKTVAIVQPQTDPIDVSLQDIPSGGQVSVLVKLYSADGCIVGFGQIGPIANLAASAALIELAITELSIPLGARTQYAHQLKLGYTGGAHVWQPGAAPVATRANLCQGSSTGVCQLNGITVHTASGMAGYGFLAGGAGVGQCGSGSSSGIVNTVRNIFLGDNPDRGQMALSCGYAAPAGIAYDDGASATAAVNFYIQPGDDGYHLRPVSLVPGSRFDESGTLSWGRFTHALDSLCVVSSGYVVGVNRQTHQMEILTLLKSGPFNSANEPASVPFAVPKLGLGSRVGRCDTPVAVASLGGLVLVLEQGNRRVQAFDTNGNSKNQFAGGTSSVMLLSDVSDAVYVDLAVESAGFIYVLSYGNNGLLPSDYRLDLYDPDGSFLSSTSGMAAGRMAVDLFRNVYALNYEPVTGAPQVEPSISQWLPVTAGSCPLVPIGAAAAAQRNLASCRIKPLVLA